MTKSKDRLLKKAKYKKFKDHYWLIQPKEYGWGKDGKIKYVSLCEYFCCIGEIEFNSYGRSGKGICKNCERLEEEIRTGEFVHDYFKYSNILLEDYNNKSDCLGKPTKENMYSIFLLYK